jgi:hypothetical protein
MSGWHDEALTLLDDLAMHVRGAMKGPPSTKLDPTEPDDLALVDVTLSNGHVKRLFALVENAPSEVDDG